MLRRLLIAADVLLILVAVFLGSRLYATWQARAATPVATSSAPAEPPLAPPAPVPVRPPFAEFTTVVERNLFSPTRTEAPPEPPARPVTAANVPVAPPPPKPRLYGVVVLPDGRSRAYLEDIQRRRVFGYSEGDLVADSRLEQIRTDRVVLRRGAEVYEVLLHDPTKPRPVSPPAAVGAAPPTAVPPARPPGVQSGAEGPVRPGVRPRPQGSLPPRIPGVPGPRPPAPPVEPSRPGDQQPQTSPDEDDP